MKKVLLVEDDEILAEGLGRMLEGQGYSVRVARSAQRARSEHVEHATDLVLLDWNLPDGDGPTLCRHLREAHGDLPIIFLTVRDSPSDMVEAFRSGTDDYVVKPFDSEVLLSRVRAVLRRSSTTSRSILHCGELVMDLDRTTCTLSEHELTLTATEWRILRLLMERVGRTMSRRVLIDEVWGEEGTFVNDNTLTVAIKRLREKLGDGARIATVRSFGYRLEAPR